MTTTTTVPTWEHEKAMLSNHMDLSEVQMEAIRRAGAKRRHTARVEAARQELEQLLGRIVVPGASPVHRAAVWGLVREAIESSIAQIGAPGSACGTSPPGWYRNSPHVGARIAALRAAMETFDPGSAPIELRVHAVDEKQLVLMDYQFDEPTVGRIDPEWGPEFRSLAEHLASNEIIQRSADVDAWIVSGGEGLAPSPPPVEVVEFHAALVEVRRNGEPA